MNARDDNDLVVVKVGGSLYDLPGQWVWFHA